MKKYITFVAVSSLLFCSSCTSFLEETGIIRICIYTQMFVRKTPRCRTREQEMGLIINFITIH